MDDDRLRAIRAYVYGHFAATAAAPAVADIAAHFTIAPAAAEAALRALHDKHALFLEPGTATIRMANPFSAVATPYRVTAGRRVYRANCAWDCFGVVAALGAAEATIDAPCAATGRPLHVAVAGGALVYDGAPIVHFLLPFAHWYDDLIHT